MRLFVWPTRAVRELTLLPDHAPDLVVLDTVSRCMAGLDENLQKDASAVVASLDYLRRELECATLVIHHTGLNESRERGSSVFRGAVDALLSLRESDGVLTLQSDKMRDGPALEPLHFRLLPVAGSMVLGELDPATDTGRPLGKVPTAVWHSLRTIATAEGITCSAWKANSGVPHASFHRARKTLLSAA